MELADGQYPILSYTQFVPTLENHGIIYSMSLQSNDIENNIRLDRKLYQDASSNIFIVGNGK